MKNIYVTPTFEVIIINTKDILFMSPLPEEDDFWTDDY